jgi:hypothetical protein
MTVYIKPIQSDWSNIDQFNSNDRFNRLFVEVDKKQCGLSANVVGTLQLSPKGFVYADTSKTVLWIKFLGLATYLSITGAVTKCKHVAKELFNHRVTSEDRIELTHRFHLASIAGKAIVGKGDKPIMKRVEQFALAEINHNRQSDSAIEELNTPRSERFASGHYVARCMQPLLHTDQVADPRLQQQIDSLNTIITNLSFELSQRSPQKGFVPGIVAFMFYSRPYKEYDEAEISEMLADAKYELSKKYAQQTRAERANRYAAYAIMNQSGYLKQALRDTVVETQADVKCGEFTCYKQEKICGILYKIDCCFLRCWAVDCGCCQCCLAPDLNTFCMIS